jgi:hypothetical protein
MPTMTSRTGKQLAFVVLVQLGAFVGAAAGAAQVHLDRKLAGSPVSNYTSAAYSACQPAPQSDFQVRRFVPGMMQGYFRFDWTLYKDGQPYQSDTQWYDLRGGTAWSYQNHTYVKVFFALPSDPGTYTGRLEVRRRNGYWTHYDWNELVIDEFSPAVHINNVIPTNSFKLRNSQGVFVSPPANGAPIVVSLNGGVTMDASATQCATGYLIIVHEANMSGVRSNQNELDTKWLTGHPGASMNLQQFVTTYSQSDGTGYFSLLGANISSGPLAGQPRFYRIGLQAAGAPWNPQVAMIRVAW